MCNYIDMQKSSCEENVKVLQEDGPDELLADTTYDLITPGCTGFVSLIALTSKSYLNV